MKILQSVILAMLAIIFLPICVATALPSEQAMAPYCTPGDMVQYRRILQQMNDPAFAAQILTNPNLSAQMTQGLSRTCQNAMGGGGSQPTVDCSACRRRVQTCLIVTHGGGPCAPCPPPCG
jgi:hypothetical protein